VEEVPEAVLEVAVALVDDLQDAVLDPEGPPRVLAQGQAADLWRPAGQAATVEERDLARGQTSRAAGTMRAL